jgi:hypothetical protein
MLGYMEDKRDYFKGNLLEYNLKKAVSFSGGNQSQYNYFKSILQYSISNLSTKRFLHDIKAGEFTLHLFPLKVQCLLSIIFYKYELDLVNEYSNYSLVINNILLPSEQLRFSNIIKNTKYSFELLDLLDQIKIRGFDLTDINKYLNIPNINLDLNKLSFLESAPLILNAFDIPEQNIKKYLSILQENDRLTSMMLSAQALNYKPQSYHYLTEALTIWHQNSSI